MRGFALDLRSTSKRLTNTPVRQAGYVLKCPDDRKNTVLGQDCAVKYAIMHGTHNCIGMSGAGTASWIIE